MTFELYRVAYLLMLHRDYLKQSLTLPFQIEPKNEIKSLNLDYFSKFLSPHIAISLKTISVQTREKF